MRREVERSTGYWCITGCSAKISHGVQENTEPRNMRNSQNKSAEEFLSFQMNFYPVLLQYTSFWGSSQCYMKNRREYSRRQTRLGRAGQGWAVGVAWNFLISSRSSFILKLISKTPGNKWLGKGSQLKNHAHIPEVTGECGMYLTLLEILESLLKTLKAYLTVVNPKI